MTPSTKDPYHGIVTGSIQESNERLLNLISMADGTGRQEIYLIAKGHVPNTLILGAGHFPMSGIYRS